MPTWVRWMAIVVVVLLFGIPAILLALAVSFWGLLLLLGLIFIPVVLLQPAIDRSRSQTR